MTEEKSRIESQRDNLLAAANGLDSVIASLWRSGFHDLAERAKLFQKEVLSCVDEVQQVLLKDLPQNQKEKTYVS